MFSSVLHRLTILLLAAAAMGAAVATSAPPTFVAEAAVDAAPRSASPLSFAGAPAAKARCATSRGIVSIGLSRTKYPNILAHNRRAIEKGWPRTMRVNRRGADARRAKLLARIPTKRGFDRDEYPAAVGRGKGKGLERGSSPRGWRADVEYVPSSENRSAGATMGIKLRRFCDGVRFRIIGF